MALSRDNPEVFDRYLNIKQEDTDMPIIAKATANYEKAPVGMQQSVCVFVHDIGTQVGEYQGQRNVRHQIIVTWELAEKEISGEPFLLSKFYTLSLNEKATLRKDLESWRGKAFSEEEAQGFDVEKLIGANCFLNVTATEKDKRAISAITPLPKGMQPIQITQTVPPQRLVDFINAQRAKSLEAIEQPEHNVDTGESTSKVDDLPF